MCPLSIHPRSVPPGVATERSKLGPAECLLGSEVFVGHRAALQALLQANDLRRDCPSGFSDPAWLDAWSSTLGADHDYFCFVSQDRQGWLAALPLMRRQVQLGKLSIWSLVLASWPELDNFELPARSQADRLNLCREMLQLCRTQISNWQMLYIREISQGGPTHFALRQACQEAGWGFHEELKAQSPVLWVDAFLAGGDHRSKNERYRIRKFRKKLAKHGRIEFQFERVQAESLAQYEEICLQVERASWKASNGGCAGFFMHPGRREFVRKLWAKLVCTQSLAIGVLKMEGAPIAVHWGMMDGDRFLSYYTSYAQNLRTCGPGSVLLDEMIQAAPDLEIQFFDASRGGVSGKHILGRYGCPIRRQIEFIAFRPGVKGKLLRWVHQKLKPQLRALRSKS